MTSVNDCAWHYCAHCGSLFRSDSRFDKDRVCDSCGKTPVKRALSTDDENQADPKTKPSEFSLKPELVQSDGRRSVRKKHQKNILLRVVIIWSCLLLVIAGFVYNSQKSSNPKSEATRAHKMTEGTLADEKVSILNSALPQCSRMLEGFLTAGPPEFRSQFIFQPIKNAGAMARFYAFNSFPRVDLKRLHRRNQEMIKVGDEWMILTRWQEDEENGQIFDAIFRKDKNEWKLDWRHFAQYSDFPWVLFMAGEGPSEAEFRLLARRRMAQNISNVDSGKFSITLAAAEFGTPSRIISESPDFMIHRSSDEGRLLESAFESRLHGEKLFQSSIKPLTERGIIQIQVKILREEVEGVRSFKLTKVLGCHWLDRDRLKKETDPSGADFPASN